MKTGYVLLGSAVLVGIAGALAGAAIGTSPMMRDGVGSTLPDAPIVTSANRDLRNNQRAPDHYDVITPDGRIGIAEITERGRLRNAQGRNMPHGYGYDPTRADRMYRDTEAAKQAREEALIAYTSRPPAQQEAAAAEIGLQIYPAAPPDAALEPDAAPAPTPPSRPVGKAKVVDVGAALADRD